MEIALIRHARPGRVDHGPGSTMRADPELDAEGRAQADALADHLASTTAPPFAGLHSSTMRRAIQTAAPLADRLGLDVHRHSGLVEYDHDLPFYIPTEEIDGDFETYWADLQRGIYAGHHLDLTAFQARVTDTIDHIIAAHHPDDLVGIICHGGVVSAYLASVVSSPFPLFFEAEYTSISRVLITTSGRRQLLSAAETPHRGFGHWITARHTGARRATTPS